MKRWIKRKLRVFLGVPELEARISSANRKAQAAEDRLASYVSGAVDTGFRGNTQIVVLTRLKKGYVQFYDFDAKDGKEIVARCADIMGPAWPESVFDAPREFHRFIESYK